MDEQQLQAFRMKHTPGDDQGLRYPHRARVFVCDDFSLGFAKALFSPAVFLGGWALALDFCMRRLRWRLKHASVIERPKEPTDDEFAKDLLNYQAVSGASNKILAKSAWMKQP